MWIAGAILLGAVLIGGVLLVNNNQTPPRQPAYSLSPGPMGMTSGNVTYGYILAGNEEISTENLVERIQTYLDRYDDPDLVVARLREFELAYQVEVVERSTGRYAFGLMVDKATTQVSPEAGPNVFWNTAYGTMIAEVGGGYGMLGRLLPQEPVDEIALTATAARDRASQAIQELDNLELDDEVKVFYGFYEFTVMQDGDAVGELDVNGYSGQIWFKEWSQPQLSVADLSTD